MPYLERSGKPTIYYELDDYTDPWKQAPVVLLQHGFGRSSRFWYSWVPYLSRFYRVVRPDLRGLGNSSTEFDVERELGLAQYLDDLNAIIDDVGVDSVHYCGEASGGLLGMAFAAEHAERVRTLSLVAAPTYINQYNKDSTTYGYSSRIEALRKMGARGWAEASNSGRRFPPDGDPGMLAWFVDELGKSNLEVLVAMTRWSMEFSAAPYLPRITAPVLGLYPSAGTVTDDTQIQMLRDNVPGIRIVHLATHYQAVVNIKPATCALEVLHFVAQHDGIACHE